MAERSKATVLKTVIPRDRNRGFESHSLLQKIKKRILIDSAFFVLLLSLSIGKKIGKKIELYESKH